MKSLVTTLGVLLCFTFSVEAEWRLSDALGTDRGPAPQGVQLGWLLRLEPQNEGEVRTLFRDGLEQSQRLVDRDAAGRLVRVRELRAGLPVWETRYDPEAGLPVEEQTFEAGEVVETALLEYSQRALSKRVVSDSQGNRLYTDTLSRWPDGSLRRLERDGPAGPLAEAAWSYGNGALVRSWVADEETKSLGQHRLTTYALGRTVETLASALETLSTRVTERTESGSLETRTARATEKVERRTLDRRGRVTEEVVSVKGLVTETRRWIYDERDRVTEVTTEAAGPREVWVYVYRDDEVLASLTRGGTLVREEVLRDGERTSVRLFDRGALFLVETWEGGKRTKETYYQKGLVVRERTP